MRKLSISRAWDETRATLAADGRLMMIVALALIALPAAIGNFIFPATDEVQTGNILTNAPGSLGESALMLLIAVVGIVGQLAIIRLAIGPSLTVGEAIKHGARRTPAYIGAALLIILAVVLIAIPMALILLMLGMTLDAGAEPPSGPALVVLLLFLMLFTFLAVRMMMTSPVASAERTGPLEIIKRSWKLSSGNWWRLFGFVLLFLVAVALVLMAIILVASLIVSAVTGPVEPHSVSALIIALIEAVLSAAATTLFVVMLARIYVQLAGEPAADVSVPSSGT